MKTRLRTAYALALLGLSASILGSCASGPASSDEGEDGSFRFEARLDGLETGTVYLLAHGKDGMKGRDTATIVDGVFRFDGRLDQPALHYVHVQGQAPVPVFFESGAMTWAAHADSLGLGEVTGSSSHDALMEFLDGLRAYDRREAALKQAYQALVMTDGRTDTVGKGARLTAIIDSLNANLEGKIAFQTSWPLENAGEPAGPFAAWINLQSGLYQKSGDPEKTREALLAARPGSPYTKWFNEQVARQEGTRIGGRAPDFSLPTPEGETISLSDYRGRYVLLDFWASWCRPCLAEFPYLKEAQQTWAGEEFAILGVSLDNRKAYWRGAIDRHELAWDHVSDLKQWRSEAAALYGVRSIPASFLIDPEGVIVARNLRGEALHAKLREIFGKG